MRALVIDDSKATRSFIRLMLNELGFEVTEAPNGSEALERLRELGPPELALVDWNMPVMNGYEFVQAVRSNPAYNDMRLMMVSTENALEQLSRALLAGANEYVMKPFTKEIIREKIELLGILP